MALKVYRKPTEEKDDKDKKGKDAKDAKAKKPKGKKGKKGKKDEEPARVIIHPKNLRFGMGAEQIAKLSLQMEKAYQKVQDIAVKAIEGSSNAKSLANLQQLLNEQTRKQPQEK